MLPFAFYLASLDLTIVDAGKPVAARVLIEGASVPEGAVAVPIGPHRWFASDGRVHLDVAGGAVRILVERGPEYETISDRMQAPGKKVIALKRWIDMKQR